MSSGLSGTYQTALQASDMVDTKVTVIDSKSISFDSATKSNDLLN